MARLTPYTGHCKEGKIAIDPSKT